MAKLKRCKGGCGGLTASKKQICSGCYLNVRSRDEASPRYVAPHMSPREFDNQVAREIDKMIAEGLKSSDPEMRAFARLEQKRRMANPVSYTQKAIAAGTRRNPVGELTNDVVDQALRDLRRRNVVCGKFAVVFTRLSPKTKVVVVQALDFRTLEEAQRWQRFALARVLALDTQVVEFE